MRSRSAVTLVLVLIAAVAVSIAAVNPHWPIWLVASIASLGAIGKPIIDAAGSNITHSVAARGQRLPRVRDPLDRAVLGIHPAIPLPDDSNQMISRELPTYIARDIDLELRGWLAAHTRTGGFVLVVGSAAAGKTRTAYEAIKATVPSWRLLVPDTHGDIGPISTRRTVIWLNDIHSYLSADGIKAASIRRLLTDKFRRALIVGTIWPDRFDALVADNNLDVINRDAHEVLDVLAHRFDLGPKFTEGEIAIARELAKQDPRLAEAVQIGNSTIAETLAAAPELFRRWRHSANPYGAAVITAAVIARRAGHPEPLPAAVLQSLAHECLTLEQRGRAANDWFSTALEWARLPVRGEAAPLTPQARVAGSVDGEKVSDVLVQRWADPITPKLWNLLINYATPISCQEIGYSAMSEYGLAKIAEDAFRKSTTGDNVLTLPLMMDLVSKLADRRGDATECEIWRRKADENGFPFISFLYYATKENKTEAAYWQKRLNEVSVSFTTLNAIAEALGTSIYEASTTE